MEIAREVVNVLQMVVTTFGGGLALFGGVQLFQGFQDQNGTQKIAGIGAVVGGVGIVVLSMRVVPLILSSLSV